MANTVILSSLHVHTSAVDLATVSPPLSLGQEQKLERNISGPRRLQFRSEAGQMIRTVSVKPWDTIDELRDLLTREVHGVDETNATDRVRLFFRGHELAYKRTVDSNDLQDMDVIHVKTAGCKDRASKPRLEVLCGSVCPHALVPILDAARDGLNRGLSPELTPSGLGGTYFLKNAHEEIVGVFKPEDEEAFTPNNPKGNTGQMGGPSVRKGMLSGEANLREVAAYMLDHQKFANVPATVRVEVKHHVFGHRAKVGSFQEFKRHDEEAGDLSSSLFSQDEAHKIAIMDIRLLNTDRNDENLLVRRHQDQLELIPIDHGCSLPNQLQVNWHDWSWLSWPQTKEPFSKTEKEYIGGLDPSMDSMLLSQELAIGWRNLLMLQVATTFLQKGAAADLSLFDIASMMVRDDTSVPSMLESIFTQARALAEVKRSPARAGLLPRRSPALACSVPRSPNSPHSPNAKTRKALRRNNSNIDLSQLTSFSLPDSQLSKKSTTKSKDDHNWEGTDEEQQQESFDGIFFQCLEELMESIISQRLAKKRALRRLSETFKACSSSAPKPAPRVVTSLKREQVSPLFSSPRYDQAEKSNNVTLAQHETCVNSELEDDW